MKIVDVTGLGDLWALRWACQTFLGQSIGFDKSNTFQYFCRSHSFGRFVGVRVGVAHC